MYTVVWSGKEYQSFSKLHEALEFVNEEIIWMDNYWANMTESQTKLLRSEGMSPEIFLSKFDIVEN